MTNFETPNIDFSNRDRALQQVWSYVLSMQEQVEYWLRNLDAENFNDAGLKEIAGMFKADTIISNTNITQEIYADYGNIADLTVDRLRTDYKKAQMFLTGDMSDVNYIYIHDETISFITATAGSGTEQLTEGERKFCWTDDTHTQMTSEKTTDYPVTVYKYTELTKASIAFTSITLPDGTETVMPVLTLGAGNGTGDNDKLIIYKPPDEAIIKYVRENGEKTTITLSDFVDAKMRRLKSCAIDKTAGSISVTMEGETTPVALTYTETDTSMTFTWPDSHTATISIS